MYILPDILLEDVQNIIEELVFAFTNLPNQKKINPKGKAGGHLFMCKRFSGEPLLLLPVGTMPEYPYPSIEVVMKKAKILQIGPGYLTSFQGRCPTIKLWGGAIAISFEDNRLGMFNEKTPEQLVVGFSGLTELGDEAVVIELMIKLGQLLKLGLLTEAVWLRMVSYSINTIFDQLHKETGEGE